MFEANLSATLPKPAFYDELAMQARALFAGESNRIANAANFSALLYHALPDLNWAGFYFMTDGELVVGPFQGKPACVRIALGRGVCGRAAQTRETQLVPDVRAFPDHIACDAASRSEIVVPLQTSAGELIGVLDIDSPQLARFDDEDRQGLEALARLFVASIEG
ncbi:GAF domain-containing protein [Caballeronia telluris]|uniref:GAF sensor protein n=1 Tax=Caballeronia telluris TaxID=326475 RepID=A0A158H9G4_9BURK|nr:GAF domain-containing protein [Caballeronia telluris]SAL41052.1 putative GAF sensor protein [Caballeronia telluris]